MHSSRPYMIRAMHEWIIDNEFTPYALVDATHADVVIPREYVEDGKILLNVSPNATQNLNLGNEFILFHARFNGVSMEVSFPIDSVMAIYAKENGRGMMFKEDELSSDSAILGSSKNNLKPSSSGPVAVQSPNSVNETQNTEKPDSDKSNKDDFDPDGNGPSGSKPPKKPSLKIVK